MGYRLNEDSSILYNGNIAVLKAANDVGKAILTEVLKVSNKEVTDVAVTPLNYEPNQNVWLNINGKYLIFDLSNKGVGVELIEAYQKQYNENIEPRKDAKVANISGGALATDGGIPIVSTESNFVDVPKDSDVKIAKLKSK